MLEAALVTAALVAGITGAWSPCGLSMVETLAPSGYAGRLRTSMIACLTFGLGALAGGVATFGGLALAGAAIGGGSAPALIAGIALAAAAGVGELRGTRIVPQVRRQVPESWRRVLPVPLAAGLYGVLLGLGFTTFILSFAVWALAGLSVALGDPGLGLLIGLGFGIGRLLPVIALAPAAGPRAGAAVHAAMAERPAIYRSLRLIDAGAMLACAGVLWAGPAQAAHAAGAHHSQFPRLVTTTAAPATDPSAGSGALAWQEPGRAGRRRRPGGDVGLPGRDPVIDGDTIAWRDGDVITFAALGDLAWRSAEVAPGADAYGFSDGWLVWRAPRFDSGALLLARPRDAPGTPARTLESVPPGAHLGRPELDGDRVVYHVAGSSGSRIVLRDLTVGSSRELRRSRRVLLTNPALHGDTLLHVASSSGVQEVLSGSIDGTDASLYAIAPTARRDATREPGRRRHAHYRFIRGRYRSVPPPRLSPRPRSGSAVTLWTTALDENAAYVTRLTVRGTRTGAALLRIPR